MQRIVIVGRSGTGKSTLARCLGERLGLPVIHLDQHYFDPGWRIVEPDRFAAQVAAFAAGERWIIEGNYSSTLTPRLARADTVIALDRHRALCTLTALVRALRYRGQVRPDMAPGCAERFDPAFLRFVWNWKRTRVDAALGAFAGAHVELHSRREIGRFLDHLTGLEA